MAIKLHSTWDFKEKLCFIGTGGAGKTNAALNIATHINAEMFVLDADDSQPYQRALATDFVGYDNVHVDVVDTEFQAYAKSLASIINDKDKNRPDNWLNLDTISPTWQAVRTWYLEILNPGKPAAEVLIELRKAYPDSSEYHKALNDLLNWDIIKGEYGNKIWNALKRWKGHYIISAEVKANPKNEKNEEKRDMYGVIGYQPVAEGRIIHAPGTMLYFQYVSGMWRVTTIKDRNREPVDRMEITDFGVDYLMGVAGWERVKKGKK